VLIAFLHSPKSFALMVVCIIPYYLFLPTLVGWFSAYAFARTWDLTWGNRPASTEHGNLSATSRQNAESALKAKAMTVCIFILVINFAFIFLVQQFESQKYTILVLAGFIFTFAAVQMLFSIFYFVLYYDPRRIIQTCWRVVSYPFRRRRTIQSESEEDEINAPDFKSEFGSQFGKIKTGKSGSSSVSRTNSQLEIKSSSSKSSQSPPSHSSSQTAEIKHSNSTRGMNITEIKPSRSNTAIEITDPDMRDPAQVIRSPPSRSGSGTGYGQVKRTSSIANAV